MFLLHQPLSVRGEGFFWATVFKWELHKWNPSFITAQSMVKLLENSWLDSIICSKISYWSNIALTHTSSSYWSALALLHSDWSTQMICTLIGWNHQLLCFMAAESSYNGKEYTFKVWNAFFHIWMALLQKWLILCLYPCIFLRQLELLLSLLYQLNYLIIRLLNIVKFWI